MVAEMRQLHRLLWAMLLASRSAAQAGVGGEHATAGRWHEDAHANKEHLGGQAATNKGHVAHHAKFSFIVTGGKPDVLTQDSETRAAFKENVMRDLDEAMQSDLSMMHERHNFTLWKIERWSPPGTLKMRVKCHVDALLYGETTPENMVDHLNRQTLKNDSPVMQGTVLRSLDLENIFVLDQSGAICAPGYLFESTISHCCPEWKYKHTCECPGQQANLLVDIDDKGCTLGKSCHCTDIPESQRLEGVDHSVLSMSRVSGGKGAKAFGGKTFGQSEFRQQYEMQILFFGMGLGGLVCYTTCGKRVLQRTERPSRGRARGHHYGKVGRDEYEADAP